MGSVARQLLRSVQTTIAMTNVLTIECAFTDQVLRKALVLPRTDEKWEQRLDELVAFHKKHGHFNAKKLGAETI